MKDFYFSSNINCDGCVSKVKDTLDNHPSILQWGVNTDHPKKILHIKAGDLDVASLTQVLDNLGFTISPYRKGFFQSLRK